MKWCVRSVGQASSYQISERLNGAKNMLDGRMMEWTVEERAGFRCDALIPARDGREPRIFQLQKAQNGPWEDELASEESTAFGLYSCLQL